MKKRPNIFTSIILTICILIAAPFNVYATGLPNFDLILSRSVDSDPANGICAKLEGMAVGTNYIYIAK